MRTHFKISAILATALLMSTVGVVAQIGEFGAAARDLPKELPTPPAI